MTEHLAATSPTTSPSGTVTPGQRKLGLVVTVLVSAFLTFDAVIHLLNVEQVQTAMTELGWPTGLSPLIGAIEAVALVLYVVPRTSILGGILLTGYLGGAVATHLRAESAVASTTLFPVYTGIVLWAGLWLRSALVRSMLTTSLTPTRSEREAAARRQSAPARSGDQGTGAPAPSAT